MNKNIILLTVLICAAYTSIAAAQDQAFYVGLGIGRSSADVTEISRQDIMDTGFTSLNTFQNGTTTSDIAWNIYGGFRFNENIAAEAFYTNFGKFSRDASGNGATASSSSVNFNLNSDLKISGFGAAVLLGAPVSEQWNLYAKPGLFFWDAKRTSTTTASGTTLSGSIDKNGSSLTFGVGTDYAFTEKLSGRLEWDRFFDVGDKNTTDKSNVDLLALSVQLAL